MLRFAVNGTTYSVRFEHDRHQFHSNPEGVIMGVGVTTCHVEEVEGKGKETKVLTEHTGEAKLSFRDPWNIVTARRVSLTRALHEKWPEDRSAREAFWTAYLDAKRPKSGSATP